MPSGAILAQESGYPQFPVIRGSYPRPFTKTPLRAISTIHQDTSQKSSTIHQDTQVVKEASSTEQVVGATTTVDKSTESRNQNQNHPVEGKHLKTKHRIAAAKWRVKASSRAERFPSGPPPPLFLPRMSGPPRIGPEQHHRADRRAQRGKGGAGRGARSGGSVPNARRVERAAAKRTLDGEDRSGIIQGEGKGGLFQAFPQG